MESSTSPVAGDLQDAQKNFDAGTAAVPEAIGEVIPPGAGNGTQAQPTDPGVQSFGVPVSAVRFLLSLPFNRIAVVKGDHWKLSEAEADGLAECWKPVIDDAIRRFLPNGADLGPLYGAILGTSAVVGMRMNKDEQLSKAGKRGSTTASTATERSTDASSSAENGIAASPQSWPESPDLSIE